MKPRANIRSWRKNVFFAIIQKQKKKIYLWLHILLGSHLSDIYNIYYVVERYYRTVKERLTNMKKFLHKMKSNETSDDE